MHRGGERVCEQIELYAHHWSVIGAAVSSSRLRDTVRSEINMRAAKIFLGQKSFLRRCLPLDTPAPIGALGVFLRGHIPSAGHSVFKVPALQKTV